MADHSISTVLFSAGDGKDIINAGRDTTIKLGAGLTSDKMQIEVSGSTATLSFGDGSDQITLPAPLHSNALSPTPTLNLMSV